MNKVADEPAAHSEQTTDRAPVKILVVEDEKHLAAGLKLNLEMEGYSVEVAGDARQAARLLVKPEAYDAIVLDVMLPDHDGFSFCRRIREAGNYTPVIMLTARSDPADRVTGLEAGADDYLVKPFDLAELMARMRSVLRRQRWEKDDQKEGQKEVISFGGAKVDLGSHTATIGESVIQLTRLEVDLLKYFAANPGRTLERQELLEKVWNLRGYRNTRTVDNFLARLRRYFEKNPARPVHFLSVRGVGYRFVPQP
jgi:DNA-binding response OmpR family regulator